MYTTNVNLKMYENNPWLGSQKLTRMSLPLFRTSSKDTKKFYLWFRFPSQATDILDTKNETGNGHSFRFEGKRKCSAKKSDQYYAQHTDEKQLLKLALN